MQSLTKNQQHNRLDRVVGLETHTEQWRPYFMLNPNTYANQRVFIHVSCGILKKIPFRTSKLKFALNYVCKSIVSMYVGIKSIQIRTFPIINRCYITVSNDNPIENFIRNSTFHGNMTSALKQWKWSNVFFSLYIFRLSIYK